MFEVIGVCVTARFSIVENWIANIFIRIVLTEKMLISQKRERGRQRRSGCLGQWLVGLYYFYGGFATHKTGRRYFANCNCVSTQTFDHIATPMFVFYYHCKYKIARGRTKMFIINWNFKNVYILTHFSKYFFYVLALNSQYPHLYVQNTNCTTHCVKYATIQNCDLTWSKIISKTTNIEKRAHFLIFLCNNVTIVHIDLSYDIVTS